ncbi:MAG: ATP-binding cassette domain-containing protein [Bacteroidota bacterium]
MVKIENLHFAYPKKPLLFNELSLQLQPGNIYGLLGQNGAGKTSLLKIITGLLYPKDGSCHVLDYESRSRNPNMLTDVYIIPEEFHLPSIRISEFINLNGPFYPSFSYKQFDDYMEEFKLEKNEKLTSLSYGQKKKVLLAFGLATNSRLLILDEPTNGLDIPSKSQFRRILASSLTEERTFVISTHQVRDMESLIDPIIILDDGKIIFNKSMEEIGHNLVFKVVHDEDAENALYSEDLVSGKAAVLENTDNEETQVNMELLFNAIINKGSNINQVFKK